MPWCVTASSARPFGHAGITHRFVKETRVQQVHRRMFDAAVYVSTGIQYRIPLDRTDPVVMRTQVAQVIHDEHINVSIVSVSRSAGSPQIGQIVFFHVGCSFNGDSPVGFHSTSSGNNTGN